MSKNRIRFSKYMSACKLGSRMRQMNTNAINRDRRIRTLFGHFRITHLGQDATSVSTERTNNRCAILFTTFYRGPDAAEEARLLGATNKGVGTVGAADEGAGTVGAVDAVDATEAPTAPGGLSSNV